MTSTIDADLDRLVNERPLSDAEVKQFWTDGYLLLKGILTPAEAAHYRQAILDLFPRNLDIPPEWHANQGRVKPYRTLQDGTLDDCWDPPELLPLFANEKLYAVMAQILQSPRLRVYDGSLGYSFRNESQRDEVRSQKLHLDCSVPKDKPFLYTLEETQLGGCFYLTDIEPGGGGIHVVPGGPRWVEQEGKGNPDNRSLHGYWRELEFLESVEVTGNAGDFALLHHLMPHGASHNRRTTTRIAQFLRYVRDDQPYGYGSRPPRQFNAAQLSAMTPLARRLHGVDAW